MRALVSIIMLFLGFSAHAGTGPLLVGGMIGDPTGFTMKYDQQKNRSIDGGLSYSLGGRSGAQLHADYLLQKPRVIDAGDTELDLYYGIGLRMITLSSGDDKGKLSFGPRVPVGLRHELKDPSVEFFGEVAVIVDIAPSTAADLDISVGARYRF
jgi:hypothetical protein